MVESPIIFAGAMECGSGEQEGCLMFMGGDKGHQEVVSRALVAVRSLMDGYPKEIELEVCWQLLMNHIIDVAEMEPGVAPTDDQLCVAARVLVLFQDQIRLAVGLWPETLLEEADPDGADGEGEGVRVIGYGSKRDMN